MTNEDIKLVDEAVEEYRGGWLDAVGLAYKVLRALHIDTGNIDFPRCPDDKRQNNYCNDPDCKTCFSEFAEGHIY